jgi:hypothetical protein
MDMPKEPTITDAQLKLAAIEAAKMLKTRTPHATKPIAFSKRDKQAAITSVTHGRVKDPAGCPECNSTFSSVSSSPNSAPATITQDFLEAWIYSHRNFQEIDEALVFGISHGTAVEPGPHTIQLVPIRGEDGNMHLRVVVR